MRNLHLLAASTLVLAAAAGPAFAQPPVEPSPAAPTQPAARDADQVDEVIVTAARREQTLQDVPISVAVTDNETIEQAQIRDLIDLQTVVPSLQVTQFAATGQTNFFIRGFGNGSGNDGIETSVGVFIDGVYRSRSAAALEDLPEVERIEVLRGPQSTLFGKNVSAGAISIITARPSFDFGGSAELTAGNYNAFQARGTMTGPLSDTVAIRLSATFNSRDGYVDNLATGEALNDRDRYSFRGDLLWRPNDDFTVRVLADFGRIDERCCGTVQLLNGPASGAIVALGLGPVLPVDRRFAEETALDVDPANEIENRGLSAQADWNLDFATLTSITAYRNSTNESFQDVDFTGADLAFKTQGNDISTFTQEFRLTSPADQRFSWLLGAFYQDERLETGVDTQYGPEIRAYVNALSGGAIATLERVQGRPVGTTYFTAGQGIRDFYDLDQEAYSLFGQADYRLTDRLTVTGGLAYLHDRKEAQSAVVLTDLFSQQNFTTFAGGAFRGLNALQFFYADTANHAPVNFPNAAESGVLEDDELVYAARVAYEVNDIVNVYASYATGWKAGAYNLSSDSRPPNAEGIGRTANPEEVTVYELGLKTRFRGGYVNVAVFDQSIEGFQSNAYTGTGYNLVNAGEQSVRGFEVDAALRPADWLELTGAVTYLDAEYDSFTRAPCVSFDTVRCPTAATLARDLSGERPPGIPEWSYSVSALATRDFGNGFDGYLRAEYSFSDEVSLSDNVPDSVDTYGRESLNASVALNYQPYGLEVMLWGRNLTENDTIVAAFPTVAQSGSFTGFAGLPRTYGLTVRRRF